MDRSILISPEEMEARFNSNEDPFDLTVEKWERLARFLEQAFTLEDYNVFLAGCQVAIPFCLMYGVKGQCDRCPLVDICQSPDEEEESMWSGLYRLIQAYGWAGDMLPPEPLKQYVQKFVQTLKELRARSRAPRQSRGRGTNP